MTDRITMLNRALLRIGANPLVTEQDPGAPQHLAVYDSVIERVFAYPFTFCKTTRQLPRRSAAPSPRHWAYAYVLPAGDRLGPPQAVYPDAELRRATTDYDIIGEDLLANAEKVFIVFSRLVGWERWPGDVREAVTVALMAELALSVREDRALHDRLYQKAFGSPNQMGQGGLFGQAIERDAQATPSDIVGNGDSPLLDARYGGHPLDV